MKYKLIYISLISLLVLGSCASLRKSQTSTVAVVQLTEEQQRDFDFNFYEGLRLKEEGLYPDALVSFEKCLLINPKDAGLLAEISLNKLMTGNTEEGIAHMEKALELDPDNWWYNSHLINVYSNMKRFDEAIVLAEKLLKQYPRKEAVYNYLIPLYKETEQISKAIELYDELEKITGVNEAITFDKLRMYIFLDKIKKANQEIDRLIQKYPYENKYKLIKGDFLNQLGEKEKAYEIYVSVLENEPENPYAYLSMSEYYNQQGDEKKGLEYIVLALKNGQLDLETKMEILGQHIENLLRSDVKINETEALFQMLIDHYPLEEAVHNYYAAFLLYMDRAPDAVSVYESMLNINSRNPQTWLNLMQIYFSKQDYTQAIEVADRALIASDNNLQFYFFKSLSYQLLDSIPESINTLRIAKSLFGTSEDAQLKSNIMANMGDLYQQLELTDSAFVAYDESLEFNPENIQTLNNYAYYLSLEKKELSKAERMSAKTVTKEPKNSTYLDTYAWVFYQQGNYSLAKFYIERAIDNLAKDQDPGVLYDHYGDILWMMGNNDAKALEMWKKAYESGVQTKELKDKIDNNGWER